MPYYRCKFGSNKSLAKQVIITGTYSNGVDASNGNIKGQSSSLTVPTLGYKFADITGSSDVGTGNNIDVSDKSSIEVNGGACSVKLHN